MKKVVVIAPVHAADDIRVTSKEIRSLIRKGYAISLISCAPKSPDPLRGITHIEIPRRTSLIARVLQSVHVAYLGFVENGDIYHLHNPGSIPAGILLKCMGKTIIYDTHEDFEHRVIARDWIPQRLRQFMARSVDLIEKFASRAFDGMIVTQLRQVEKFRNIPVLIRNPPIIQNISHDASLDPKENLVLPRLKIIYVGTMSQSRGIGKLINIIELLGIESGVHLELVGELEESLSSAISRSPAADRIKCHGYLCQEKAFNCILNADVGLVIIDDVLDYKHTSPNKLYEYMSLGKPFIASAFDSWIDSVKGVNAGLFVDPGNNSEIVKAILFFLDNPGIAKRMGDSGFQYIQTEFNWSLEEKKLLELYARLLGEEIEER